MLLFLYGPDTYRSREKLREIEEECRKAQGTACRVRDFDCEHDEFADFQNELEIRSLFEQKKFIVLRNVFQNTEFEKSLIAFKERLLEMKDSSVVVFQEQEIKAKSKNALYEFLQKHARVQEFTVLSGLELQKWIQREFERYQVSPSSDVVTWLARSIGGDLWRLSHEIRKLVAFQKSSNQPSAIQQSDIQMLVHLNIETDIFATIDAISQKDKKQAFLFLYRHLGKGESPYYLLSMLVYQFRTILEIKDMAERGFSFLAMAQKSKLHPYVLQKGSRIASSFSMQELKRIYQKLFRLDFLLKTGKTEPEGALDLFIASL